MIGDDVAPGATTEPDWLKAWDDTAQTWTESGFVPMSLGLARATQQVREFMEIGQPDMLPDDLRTPSVSDPDARETLRDISAQLHQASNALKRQIAAGGDPSPDLGGARYLLEELGETLDALLTGDTEGYADGLADLIYVAIGAALRCCIPLPAVWAEVHAANMRKYPPCLSCAGSGYTLFHPVADGEAWDRVVDAVLPDLLGVPRRVRRVQRAAVRGAATWVGLPIEAIWRMSGREQRDDAGACHPPVGVCAYRTLSQYTHTGPDGQAKPLFPGLSLHNVEYLVARLEAHFQDVVREPCPECHGLGAVVHRSAAGKIEKPPGWRPPSIRRALGEGNDDQPPRGKENGHG